MGKREKSARHLPTSPLGLALLTVTGRRACQESFQPSSQAARHPTHRSFALWVCLDHHLVNRHQILLCGNIKRSLTLRCQAVWARVFGQGPPEPAPCGWDPIQVAHCLAFGRAPPRSTVRPGSIPASPPPCPVLAGRGVRKQAAGSRRLTHTATPPGYVPGRGPRLQLPDVLPSGLRTGALSP